MLNVGESRPDPERLALLRSTHEPSPLSVVADAVAVATGHGRHVYVERHAEGWCWSFTHPGGAYPLLRIAARFLKVDYHNVMVRLRTVAPGVIVVRCDPDAPVQPEAWAVLLFDGPTSAAVIEGRILEALAA